jgi:glycosyltransferase involved in cell wall biosynthesis
VSSPFFSVIIPVFNREILIKRAIKSVLDQSYSNFELIIVNDGSNDKTKESILSFTDQRIVYYEQENLGVSIARNNGAKIAKAPYLAFLDSDDEWLGTKLEKQFEYIDENPETKILHGEEQWVRNGKRVNPKKIHQKGGGDQFIPSLSLCLISPSTVVLDKQSFFDLGCFREDFKVCEDYDLWLKYTSLYNVGFIKDPLIIKYGGHEDQLSQKYHSMDMYRIKSLLWILENRDLSKTRKENLLEVLDNKITILKKGFAKHQRLQELNELVQITSRVKSFSS